MKHLFYLAIFAAVIAGCGKAPPAGATAEPALTPQAKVDAPLKQRTATTDAHKNLVVLTPGAAKEIRKLLKENKKQYLRVSVGKQFQYKLDLDGLMDPKDDYLGESQGVPVLVDHKSALLVPEGITVDFAHEGGEVGFKFISPSANQEAAGTSKSLVEARRGFVTTTVRRDSGGGVVPEPPHELFHLVRYTSALGKLPAYLTPDPKDGKKHPAIVWITGGDCNSIDAGSWHDDDPANDQSASAYRKAGIIMMFPSLRGGNDNPSAKEGLLGEVDDVLAAADFLHAQDYVDPDRIYLGGHSTGGTLVLLAAECSDRFRAVFSFGPVEDVVGYGPRYCPFPLTDRKEIRLRAPGLWLHSIRSPVFVFEGTGGNLSSLKAMARNSKNPYAHFFEIKGANHFNTLAPTNRLIADKILHDTGPTCSLVFTEAELNKPFVK